MASKKIHAVSIKGLLDLDTMEITEQAKEAEFTYDFYKSYVTLTVSRFPLVLRKRMNFLLRMRNRRTTYDR
jgi:hypothetical protein